MMGSSRLDRAGPTRSRRRRRWPVTLISRLGRLPHNPWRLPPGSASTPTPSSPSKNSRPSPHVSTGMAIYLPESTASTTESLTPREIVVELDKHVIGQAQAKRAVAIALRNRTRRQKLPADIADEIAPKNILMIGPTGVGKTEIARRLARLAQSPFIKVEASKFTEVGYVGRDVESMVRDLVELAVDMVKAEKADEVREKARTAAEERLLDLLLPPSRAPGEERRQGVPGDSVGDDPAMLREHRSGTRERMRE